MHIMKKSEYSDSGLNHASLPLRGAADMYIQQASLRHRRIIKLAFVLAFWLLPELMFILNWTPPGERIFLKRRAFWEYFRCNSLRNIMKNSLKSGPCLPILATEAPLGQTTPKNLDLGVHSPGFPTPVESPFSKQFLPGSCRGSQNGTNRQRCSEHTKMHTPPELILDLNLTCPGAKLWKKTREK